MSALEVILGKLPLPWLDMLALVWFAQQVSERCGNSKFYCCTVQAMLGA